MADLHFMDVPDTQSVQSSGAGGFPKQSALPLPGQTPPIIGLHTPFPCLHGPKVPGQQPSRLLISPTGAGVVGAGTGDDVTPIGEQSLFPSPGHIPPIVGPHTKFCCLHTPDVPGQQPVHCASTTADPNINVKIIANFMFA